MNTKKGMDSDQDRKLPQGDYRPVEDAVVIDEIHFQREGGGSIYDVKFSRSATDEQIREYFEQKCGGVFRWWRMGAGGDVEIDFCDICGRGRPLQRKYYRYLIPCDCCNHYDDNHFEIVRHCAQCTPAPPKKVTVVMKPIDD